MNKLYLDSDILISEFKNDGSNECISYLAEQLMHFDVSGGGKTIKIADQKHNDVFIASPGTTFYVIKIVNRDIEILVNEDIDFVQNLTKMVPIVAECPYERVFRYNADNGSLRNQTMLRAMYVVSNGNKDKKMVLDSGIEIEHTEDGCMVKYGEDTICAHPGQYLVYIYGTDTWSVVSRRLLERITSLKFMPFEAHLTSNNQKLFNTCGVCVKDKEDPRSIKFNTYRGAVLTTVEDVFEKYFVERGNGKTKLKRAGYTVTPIGSIKDAAALAEKLGGTAERHGDGIKIITDKFELVLPHRRAIILTPDENPEIAVPISSINAVSLVYDRYNDGSGFSIVE